VLAAEDALLRPRRAEQGELLVGDVNVRHVRIVAVVAPVIILLSLTNDGMREIRCKTERRRNEHWRRQKATLKYLIRRRERGHAIRLTSCDVAKLGAGLTRPSTLPLLLYALKVCCVPSKLEKPRMLPRLRVATRSPPRRLGRCLSGLLGEPLRREEVELRPIDRLPSG
jgi:hypothetical protein